jgi:AcrR family transcriptional regulator
MFGGDHMTGSRRQAQKEETRRLIKEAAYNLFETKGYEATTMRRLAASAGVGLGTIFQHFPDKHSLLAACFREDLRLLIESALADMPERGLVNQLLHLTRTFYTFYARRPALFRVLLHGIAFQQTEWIARIQADLMEFLSEVALLVTQAQQRGEISQELEPQLTASAFWSFYVLSLQMGLGSDSFDIPAQVALVGMLLNQHLHGFIQET